MDVFRSEVYVARQSTSTSVSPCQIKLVPGPVDGEVLEWTSALHFLKIIKS